MASTLGTGTLTVTLTEAITLNGYDQGSTNTLEITGVTSVSKRIVTATTSEPTILEFAAAVGSGQYVKGDVKYIRITNVDNTNHCVLTFIGASSHEFAVKLDYGQSFIYNGDLSTGVVGSFDADSSALTVSLVDLESITADAATGTVDLELFVASKT